jgi:hypothetical protein
MILFGCLFGYTGFKVIELNSSEHVAGSVPSSQPNFDGGRGHFLVFRSFVCPKISLEQQHGAFPMHLLMMIPIHWQLRKKKSTLLIGKYS